VGSQELFGVVHVDVTIHTRWNRRPLREKEVFMASTTLSRLDVSARATNPGCSQSGAAGSVHGVSRHVPVVNVAVVHIAGNLSASIDETSYVY